VNGNKKRLGRGLDGLLPSVPNKAAGPAKPAQGFVAPIEELHPNREQPRTRFEDAALNELAASIAELGVLEPILVRKRAAGGYEIIAGERRWRAAQRAGLKEIPVFVRELTSQEAFEAALVENLQREDLNPVETARAFMRLVEEHGYTQETLAKRVGKDRTTITNALRVLKLPESVLAMLEDGTLSEGHGRALLGAHDAATMKRLAHEAQKKSWSVRETERAVRAAAKGPGAKGAASKSANVKDLESRVSKALGARVTVDDKKGKGKLVVAYTSYEELDRILAHILD
jgi:ParB family transcriptional regulator, chromosome partitioning protein